MADDNEWQPVIDFLVDLPNPLPDMEIIIKS